MLNCLVCNSKLPEPYISISRCYSDQKIQINNRFYTHQFDYRHEGNNHCTIMLYLVPIPDITSGNKTIIISFLFDKWIYKNTIIGNIQSSFQDLIDTIQVLEVFS